jgi:AI-2 transport protein TqsA
MTAVCLVALNTIFTAVYLARSVFAPVAFALFIIAVVRPLQRRLQSHLPRLVALAIVILATIGVFIARCLGFRPGGTLAGQRRGAQPAPLRAGHGIAVAGPSAEHFNVGWLVRTA